MTSLKDLRRPSLAGGNGAKRVYETGPGHGKCGPEGREVMEGFLGSQGALDGAREKHGGGGCYVDPAIKRRLLAELTALADPSRSASGSDR